MDQVHISPKGRKFQDFDFTVPEYAGTTLRKLLGLLHDDLHQDQPILLYILVDERGWERFFLDIGAGFWEDWGEIDLDEKYVDYTKLFRITGRKIMRVECLDGIITIELEESENLVLQPIDPNDMESNSVISLKKRDKLQHGSSPKAE